MEWYVILALIFGSFVVLLASGIPVAFAFMIVNVVPVFLLMGGEAGLNQLTFTMFRSLAKFIWLPIPMFVLMGEVMFRSRVAKLAIDALDNCFGRVPATGVLLSTLSGSSIGTTALLGSTLLPEMEKRGYKKQMSLGPILGSGCLAMMIPPSTLAVVLAAIAEISVAKILIGGIIPGLMMAIFYSLYIIIRVLIQPSIAHYLRRSNLLCIM
ncbi:TRAP transporter large permease subunit [Chloroflexota bacterium]